MPCVLKASITAIKNATDDEEKQLLILRRALRAFSETSWDTVPLKLHKIIREIIKEETGVDDPYRALKKKYNEKALSLYPEMKKIISESDDSLKTSAKLAALGNTVDFGVYSGAELEKLIESVKRLEFSVNDYDRFRRRLENSETLLYFLDNSGEIVFDKVFLETMIEERGKPFEGLTIVCKSSPVLNDATLEDVKETGLDELPNVELKTVDIELKPPKGESVENWVAAHDLTILKGQANLEGFIDLHGVFFLLVAKCDRIAKVLSAELGGLVLKYNP
ncbi:MAG: DUF89 family protein [Thaumarchaeota archaeon]|nr:DUF89 family protein [Nitrososphaerota archaeon]